VSQGLGTAWQPRRRRSSDDDEAAWGSTNEPVGPSRAFGLARRRRDHDAGRTPFGNCSADNTLALRCRLARQLSHFSPRVSEGSYPRSFSPMPPPCQVFEVVSWSTVSACWAVCTGKACEPCGIFELRLHRFLDYTYSQYFNDHRHACAAVFAVSVNSRDANFPAHSRPRRATHAYVPGGASDPDQGRRSSGSILAAGVPCKDKRACRLRGAGAAADQEPHVETSKCLRGDLPAGSRAIRRRGARESNNADGDARPDRAALTQGACGHVPEQAAAGQSCAPCSCHRGQAAARRHQASRRRNWRAQRRCGEEESRACSASATRTPDRAPGTTAIDDEAVPGPHSHAQEVHGECARKEASYETDLHRVELRDDARTASPSGPPPPGLNENVDLSPTASRQSSPHAQTMHGGDADGRPRDPHEWVFEDEFTIRPVSSAAPQEEPRAARDGRDAGEVVEPDRWGSCEACSAQDWDEREQRAAFTISRWWKGAVAAPAVPVTLEWWDKRVQRARGSLLSHVRYFQALFRAAVAKRPGCWTRGGWRGMPRLIASEPSRCRGGRSLATDTEFSEQEERAEQMLLWYEQYVAILRRLQSGDTPNILHLFGGGGGSSEGGKRAGTGGCSVDNEPQPDYERRFGAGSFIQGDALSWALIAELKKKWRSIGCLASPPCKPYSRALSGGTSQVPMMIPQTRDALCAFFDHWAIENVMGATKHMAEGSAELFGQAFGMRVDRARRIEASFTVAIDEAVRRPGQALRRRTCLGERRRWKRVDSFGRPLPACCKGNIFAIQGKVPWKCTVDECSEAMGVDKGHMSYDRLAQAIPPAYTRLIIGQLCMNYVHDRYGVPTISYDEHVASPEATRREVASWLRGSGDDSPDAGLAFRAAIVRDGGAKSEKGNEPDSWDSSEVPGKEESDWRELEYSCVGGFDQRWSSPDVAWLDIIRPNRPLQAVPSEAELVGRNTWISVPREELAEALPAILRAVQTRGTRVTATVAVRLAPWLERLGFKQTHRGLKVGFQPDGYAHLSIGARGAPASGRRLDHDVCRLHMDPRDLGKKTWADADKRERAWRPVWWDPERWAGNSHLPPNVVEIMTKGASIELERAIRAREVPQYPFASPAARAEASIEADRAIATGHMSYVPADEVETSLAEGAVHPWTMVQQGEKWRACQDYSVETNLAARSAPFGLPTPWSVKRVIKPGKSRFAKYDLRDGFWGVPVAPGSKNLLMMRHPATGRLMRCDRLPFGFLDSPRIFCSVTEAIAQEFRRRAAGKGVYIWCYVDDFLLCGDDEAATLIGCDILEQILFELGFEFAPHKQRGVCACIEFLGLLLSNFDDTCCISLTEKREKKMVGLFDEWMRRKPKHGSFRADPVELARLLGLLVFASQVVPAGRVYMQGMLSQFQGLEVDWRRGAVRPSGSRSQWEKVPLSEAFWRDLEWWQSSFEERNNTSLKAPDLGEAAITGTDASGWGTGQVAWIDGGKEESRLRFGEAECRRPINWRELLGIVRCVDLYGAQLAGKCILVETDNMASKMAADRSGSKASDMQELIRRIVEAAERHSITLRFTHTPGVKLHRPDQTSRGDPIEEPRARVKAAEFGMLSKRFGPFSELMGAERQHESSATTIETRLWVHPTFTTVGSAMRLVGERLMAPGGERAKGLMIVPDAPEAKWGQLLRHFQVIGRLPEGSPHLEMSQLGRWKSVPSMRPTLLLSFPRSAGGVMQQVLIRATRRPASAGSRREREQLSLWLQARSFIALA
jgi:hypothetical protein